MGTTPNNGKLKYNFQKVKLISDVIMAVGEYNYHTNAELLSVNDNTWAVIDSYPFVMGIDIFHFFIFLK